jgi:hypothetical protein
MADKKKAGSVLMASLGRTKKEQMKAVYPKGTKKSPPRIKSKGPYTRGKVMGAGDLISRRSAVRGTDLKKAIRKADKEAARTGIGIAAATGAGYALGRYGPKKTEAKDTHLDKARRGAKELIKKQKTKKEKRKSHH